jgi:hypothetical protein
MEGVIRCPLSEADGQDSVFVEVLQLGEGQFVADRGKTRFLCRILKVFQGSHTIRCFTNKAVDTFDIAGGFAYTGNAHKGRKAPWSTCLAGLKAIGENVICGFCGRAGREAYQQTPA